MHTPFERKAELLKYIFFIEIFARKKQQKLYCGNAKQIFEEKA